MQKQSGSAPFDPGVPVWPGWDAPRPRGRPDTGAMPDRTEGQGTSWGPSAKWLDFDVVKRTCGRQSRRRLAAPDPVQQVLGATSALNPPQGRRPGVVLGVVGGTIPQKNLKTALGVVLRTVRRQRR